MSAVCSQLFFRYVAIPDPLEKLMLLAVLLVDFLQYLFHVPLLLLDVRLVLQNVFDLCVFHLLGWLSFFDFTTFYGLFCLRVGRWDLHLICTIHHLILLLCLLL